MIQPDMGSGYGGKHTGEAAIEAARLAKAAGKPVKVVWTRSEEFTWAYLRPAGLIEIKAGARHDGTLVAWEHHNYNSGPAAIGTPYEVANQLIQFHPAKSPLRQGSYRGLASTANHFARESHMDAMAAFGGHGPAGVPPEEPDRPKAAGRVSCGCGQIRLGPQEINAGARIRHRRRDGQGRIRGNLRRGGDRCREQEGAHSFAWCRPGSQARS